MNAEQNIERAIVGCMMADRDCADNGLLECAPEDFTDSFCRRVFTAMQSLGATDAAIDLVTVSGMFDAECAVTIAQLLTGEYVVSNFPAYVDRLKRTARLRRFRVGMEKLVADAEQEDDSCFSAAQALLDDLSSIGRDEMQPIKASVDEAVQSLGEVEKGIATGYPALDRYTGGLVKGNLVVVAGRASMGKSTFAENIASNVALRGNVVALFSLEMKAKEITRRLVLGLARVGEQAIAQGSARTVQKVLDSADFVRPMKLYVYDKGAITASKTQTLCRRVLQKEGRLDVVIVDYIGLMKTVQRRNGSRQQEIGEITHAMKQMAQELDCTVILVSQLNRGPELRNNHEPVMADLRESGDIEQDADIILFPYRPHVYDEDAPETEAEIIIAKNRNGPTGKIRLHWFGEWFAFENPAGAWASTGEGGVKA